MGESVVLGVATMIGMGGEWRGGEQEKGRGRGKQRRLHREWAEG